MFKSATNQQFSIFAIFLFGAQFFLQAMAQFGGDEVGITPEVAAALLLKILMGKEHLDYNGQSPSCLCPPDVPFAEAYLWNLLFAYGRDEFADGLFSLLEQVYGKPSRQFGRFLSFAKGDINPNDPWFQLDFFARPLQLLQNLPQSSAPSSWRLWSSHVAEALLPLVFASLGASDLSLYRFANGRLFEYSQTSPISGMRGFDIRIAQYVAAA